MKWTTLSKSAALALGLAAVMPAGRAWADQGKGQEKAAETKDDAEKKKADPGEIQTMAGDRKADRAADRAANKADKAANKADKAADKVPPGVEGGAGAGPAMDRVARLKQRAVERKERRAERATMAKNQLRQRARMALRGQPMEQALKQELERHARRMARLHRVLELAAEANDTAVLDRAESLMDKERQRHQRWWANYVREKRGGGPGGPGQQGGPGGPGPHGGPHGGQAPDTTGSAPVGEPGGVVGDTKAEDKGEAK